MKEKLGQETFTIKIPKLKVAKRRARRFLHSLSPENIPSVEGLGRYSKPMKGLCKKLKELNGNQAEALKLIQKAQSPDHPEFGKLRPLPNDGGEPKYCTAAEESKLIGKTIWEWLGWIAIGILIILIAREGRGKTWFLWAIVRSIVKCEPWPDGTPGPKRPRKVIWCEAESAQGINAGRRKMMGIPEEWVIIPGGPMHDFKIDNPEDIANLIELIKFHKPAAVIIDSLNTGISFSESSPKLLPLLKRLAEIARDYRVPILMTTHARKKPAGKKGDHVDTSDAKGSTAIGHTARITITLHLPDPEGDTSQVVVGQRKNALVNKPDPIGMKMEDGQITFSKDPI